MPAGASKRLNKNKTLILNAEIDKYIWSSSTILTFFQNGKAYFI